VVVENTKRKEAAIVLQFFRLIDNADKSRNQYSFVMLASKNFRDYHKCLLHCRLTSRGQLYICSFNVGLLRKFAAFSFSAFLLLLLQFYRG